MKKIPVKIVELTSPSGKKAVDVMIDVFDYHEIENAQEKIRQFKKNYPLYVLIQILRQLSLHLIIY